MFLAGFLLALFTVWKVADLWRRAPIMRGCGIWAGDAREAEGWGGGGGKRKEALKGLVPSGGQGHSLERLFLHSMTHARPGWKRFARRAGHRSPLNDQ